jgi:hypothetical protein
VCWRRGLVTHEQDGKQLKVSTSTCCITCRQHRALHSRPAASHTHALVGLYKEEMHKERAVEMMGSLSFMAFKLSLRHYIEWRGVNSKIISVTTNKYLVISSSSWPSAQLRTTPWRRIEGGGLASFIINLKTKLRWVVSFKVWPLYPRYPLMDVILKRKIHAPARNRTLSLYWLNSECIIVMKCWCYLCWGSEYLSEMRKLHRKRTVRHSVAAQEKSVICLFHDVERWTITARNVKFGMEIDHERSYKHHAMKTYRFLN